MKQKEGIDGRMSVKTNETLDDKLEHRIKATQHLINCFELSQARRTMLENQLVIMKMLKRIESRLRGMIDR